MNQSKKNIVFLPYNLRMWDSMESVWQAAKNDVEHCNAYVVPIPYADKNPDGSVREWHYEANEYPDYVPVEDWQTFDLKGMHPDAIVIHNPYDDMNLVTSVEARFYSRNLKFYTDKLVYIPYYATSGGMMEGQAWCPAYDHVDYIVTQSPKYRGFFDEKIPDDKFLPFGSPKFDKVINLCNNPPIPPADWQEKMRGKKVYFYNTSIGGALGDVRHFLQKMMYIFDTFRNRTDACLLWRPHPLLESTLKSMRPDYVPIYEQIRDKYISDNFGIYDTTGDIEKTIALCDAFIGDGATSVTSLFGVAGKPMFYLNNMLHHLPQKEDWIGSVNRCWNFFGKDWLMVYGNQLWYSPNHDLHYEYAFDLSEYAGGGYYGSLIEVDDKLFVCPNNAQDIIVIEDGKISRCIALKRKRERAESFAGATYVYAFNEDRIFLLPLKYPDIVCYDFRNDKLDYIPCDNDAFVREVNGEKWRGAVFCYEDWLIFASPVGNKAFAINRYTLKTKTMTLGGENFGGSQFVMRRKWDSDEYFFIPYDGRVITRINMKTGAVREYALPDNFKCYHPTKKYACDIRPFSNGIFKDDNTILLSPLWGNMFIKLHIDTGVVEEWKTPFKVTVEGKNEYMFAGSTGFFIADVDRETWLPCEYHYYYLPTRTRYTFNPETEAFTELEQDTVIDEAELRKHVFGFCKMNEWSVYGGYEDVFNSLTDFLDGNISGRQFDRNKQLKAYSAISANIDGTAGQHVYDFVMNTA